MDLRRTQRIEAAALGAVVVCALLAADSPLGAPVHPSAAPQQVVVLDSAFEDGADGWEPLGDAQVGPDDTAAHDGDASLLVTGRTEPWHGATVDVTHLLPVGRPAVVTLWVRAEDDDADVQLTVERRADGESAYDHLAQQQVTAGEWTRVQVRYTMPALADEARMYVETLGSLADLRVDAVTVTQEVLPVQTDVPRLREALPEALEVGVAVSAEDLAAPTSDLLLHHYERITPEVSLKPATLQPEEGRFAFDAADRVLDWAVENDLTVHGHAFVWHRSTPDWFFEHPDGRPLTDHPADQELLRARLRAHVAAVAAHLRERYGDRNPVRSWDVVNEPVDVAQEDGMRRSRWYDVLGPGYVADALRIAREELGPDVALYVNDYGTELPRKRTATVDLVRGLLADDVPLDGVGHQMHLNLERPVSGVEETIDAFAGLGVEQAITELDVAISRDVDERLTATPQSRLREQAEYYRALGDVVRRRADDLTSVTFWGPHDGRSWLRTWRGERPFEAPLLFDDRLQTKAAFRAFVEGASGA